MALTTKPKEEIPTEAKSEEIPKEEIITDIPKESSQLDTIKQIVSTLIEKVGGMDIVERPKIVGKLQGVLELLNQN